jgi:hypothetical protein
LYNQKEGIELHFKRIARNIIFIVALIIIATTSIACQGLAQNGIIISTSSDPTIETAANPTTKPNDEFSTVEPTTQPTECTHNYIETNCKEATCCEEGERIFTCTRCNDNYREVISIIPHVFSEPVVTVEPYKGEPGTMAKECACGLVETWEFECEHANIVLDHTVTGTCTTATYNVFTCSYCMDIISTETVGYEPCVFGDWEYIKFATPLESGEKQRSCTICGYKQYSSYEMQMAGERSIYIPHTDINAIITVATFNQESVDTYDLIYSAKPRQLSDSGPFIIGHNYGSMKNLHKTQVGQLIYVLIDGTMEIYEVRVSEYGIQNQNHTTITGSTTHTDLWHTYDNKTLHMYTCYGSGDGRWMVLAELVDTAKYK